MINIDNIVGKTAVEDKVSFIVDDNFRLVRYYDDKKGKHNSVEVTIDTKNKLDGFDLYAIGYGANEEEAVNDLKDKVGKSWSKLQEILKPIKINEFYIIPDKTKFVCTIRPPMSHIVTVEDAVLSFDNDLLAYIIKSEKLGKTWVYAAVHPYISILRLV